VAWAPSIAARRSAPLLTLFEKWGHFPIRLLESHIDDFEFSRGGDLKGGATADVPQLPLGALLRHRPRRDCWCKRLWLLKNSICLKTDPKGVTRNVSGIGENRL
jgi:hypothetical protein